MSDTTPVNVVVIMMDQLRADYFASEGVGLDTMPYLEQMGLGGARFRRAYTSSPLCVPARCSLLTGRFPAAHQVRQNSTGSSVVASNDLVRLLRKSGYRAGLSGKNHSHLNEQDFDYYRPYMHDGSRYEPQTAQQSAFDEWLKSLDHGIVHEPTPFPVENELPYRIVSDALTFVDSAGVQPFFLWLSFPEPHNPYQVPEPYFSMFPEDSVPERNVGPEVLARKPERWRWLRRLVIEKLPDIDSQWRRYRANYCGMLRLLDDQIRRFVTELDRRGLAENTLIVVVSDHGDFAGDFGLQRKGVGLPECLTRIPMIISGPGVQAKSYQQEFVSIVDVFPTICEALDIDVPVGVQGRSLWPMLRGEHYPPQEFSSVFAEVGFGGVAYGLEDWPPLHFPYEGRRYDELNTVTQSGKIKMVRKDHWKLMVDSHGHAELFDVEDDPYELVNLFDSASHAKVCIEMLRELERWTIRAEDDLPVGRYTLKQVPHNWWSAFDSAVGTTDGWHELE